MNRWVVVLVLLSCACGDRRGGGDDDDVSTDGDADADTDADADSDADADGDAATFDTCVSLRDCSPPDVCGKPAAWEAEDEMPRQCRPPCVTAEDCTALTAPMGGSASCDEGGGQCYAYCAIGGFIPGCLAPYVCTRVAGMNDGYCVLP